MIHRLEEKTYSAGLFLDPNRHIHFKTSNLQGGYMAKKTVKKAAKKTAIKAKTKAKKSSK